MKERKAGTVTLVKRAIARYERKAQAWEGDDNPQVVKMRIEAIAKVSILTDVLGSLQGRHVNLRIAAGE